MRPKLASAAIAALSIVILISFQNCSIEGAPDGDVANLSSNQNPQCASSELLWQGQCVAQFLNCTLSGGGTGQSEFVDGVYGPCVFNSCPAGNHLENSICVSNTKSCAFDDGTGLQTWNGTAYGTCAAVACNAGFNLNAGACVPQGKVIYRYFDAARSRYYWSDVNNDATAASLARVLQGAAFTLFPVTRPDASIAIYRCHSLLILGGLTFLDIGNTCQGYVALGATATLLGYAATAPIAGVATKPLYTCGPARMFTSTQAECGPGASIVGYTY